MFLCSLYIIGFFIFLAPPTRAQHSWLQDRSLQDEDKPIEPERGKQWYLTSNGNTAPNDPEWGKQWYLDGEHEPTLNVLPVWKRNITGKGIVVAVVDDGFDFNLKEIRDNYDARVSRDIFQDKPLTAQVNKHGTKCAGVIAAKANNKICGVGVAFEAKIGGIRLFDGIDFNYTKEAEAFTYALHLVDIYSNSWGAPDYGFKLRKIKSLVEDALKKGTTEGRNGKGSIYVFSSGNGGIWKDSCAFDGYVNSIYTIAVGAIDKRSMIPRYAEACSAVMATTFGDSVVTCQSHRRRNCVNNFGETSAAAAMASGIIALALQVNSHLTWRDVQHLIIRSSDPKSVILNVNDNWITNAANLTVHNKVGFGLMNAEKLVIYAEKWTSVPSQEYCSLSPPNYNQRFLSTKSLKFECNSCQIRYLEHVTLKVNLYYTRRGVLVLDLTSPQGTTSRMIHSRPLDALIRKTKFENLLTSSIQFWGEDPTGRWRVSLSNSNYHRDSGNLYSISITLYGTKDDPLAKNDHIQKPGQESRESGWNSRCSSHCCRGKPYFPFSQTCCAGQILLKHRPYKCCGARIYDSRQNVICCSRHLFDKWYGNRCCGRQQYSPWTQICCAGQVLSKRSPLKCCGTRAYDARLRKICCSGHLFDKWYGDKCCGRQRYSPWTQICCAGQVLSKRSPSKCCGTRQLFSKTDGDMC